MTTRFTLDDSLSLRQAPGASTPASERTPAPQDALPARPAAQSAAQPAETPRRVLESIFIPEGYEPNYAYPLIVWMVGPQQNKRDELRRVLPGISTRNYLGMSFCPETSLTEDATGEGLYDIEQSLRNRVERLQRRYHVHTERVFLAGFGEGATWALRLGLNRPEWFAGVAAISGKFPNDDCPLNRYRELRGKRVMLGAARSDHETTTADMLRTSRLLHAAGLRVCTRLYEGGHELTPGMLTEVDRWVMQEIFQAQRV